MISRTPPAMTKQEFAKLSTLELDEILNNLRRGEDHESGFTMIRHEDLQTRTGNAGYTKNLKEGGAISHDQEFAGSIFVGTCFSILCRSAGVDVDAAQKSVCQLSDEKISQLAGLSQFKVFLIAYGLDDPRNHVELIQSSAVNAKLSVLPIADTVTNRRTVVCTSMQHFFNKSNEWSQYKFYSAEGFGSATGGSRGGPQNVPAPPSIVGESVNGGESNVSAGVSRSRKRNIAAKSSALGGPVSKNYRATNTILFNNADEMFQDKISRTHAQEIIEELFEVWGVPLDQPEAAKYAEDLLWTFIIAVTASNKADYNVVFDIPVKPVERNGVMLSSIEADFAKFSLLLASKFGVTRRQFSRGVADDLRAFLKHEENQELLPPLATRVGCEVMLAYLAFDGSTHCTNMTTREVTFTRTLESRNLFERDDIVAQGASDKLMQGMSGGVRSVAPR